MGLLAIDFDGVVHDKLSPVPGRRMGAPIAGAKAGLEELEERGHAVIIHTVMATTASGKKAVEEWLDYYDIPYSDVTATKPNADAYLDDKAIHFDNWLQALGALSTIA